MAEKIATNFLMDGYSVETVSKNTGLSLSVVEDIDKNLKKEIQKKETVSV